MNCKSTTVKLRKEGELGEFGTLDDSIDFVEYKDISLTVIYCDLRCDEKNDFQHKSLEILQVEEVNLFFDPQTSEPFISAMIVVGLIVLSSFSFMAAYRNPNIKSKVKTIKAGMVRWLEKYPNKRFNVMTDRFLTWNTQSSER